MFFGKCKLNRITPLEDMSKIKKEKISKYLTGFLKKKTVFEEEEITVHLK